MHTFFHGWRRKAACVALLMACAFMARWLRSEIRVALGIGCAGDFPVESTATNDAPVAKLSAETNSPMIRIEVGETVQDCAVRLRLEPTLSLRHLAAKPKTLRYGTRHFVSREMPGQLIEIDWMLSHDNRECVRRYCLRAIDEQ